MARLYAVNTAGAVAGVAAAGFLAVPALGLWKTASLAAAIDLMLEDPNLMRRPLVLAKGKALFGYDAKEYEKWAASP